MPEYLRPGVFIEEIERGPRPIEGVPTSTAAFLGEAERGPTTPRLVTSYGDYKRWFGDVFGDRRRYLPYAAAGFFENGGRRLYVCRIVGAAAIKASKTFGDYTINAVGAGEWGNRVWVQVMASSTKAVPPDGSTPEPVPIGFRIRVAYWATTPDGFELFDPFADLKKFPRPSLMEDFDDLVVDRKSPDFFEKRLTDASALIEVEVPETEKLPAPELGEGGLEGGEEDAAGVGVDDFEGSVQPTRPDEQGLAALELDPYREVALVYAPRPFQEADLIAQKVIGHCERMKFRFAVVDPLQEAGRDLDPRTTLADSSYAALYYPWIQVSDPQSGALKWIPPGGHVLGVYARTDTERGVFKAPANEIPRGVVNLYVDVDDGSQEVFNPRGVNAIRQFPGRGIRVWGARTLSSNGLWKYVPVRRLFIFLERSIYENTQWVVFEPNDDKLWARLKDSIRIFLRAQWRGGALFGRTEDEAFFITCDRTTMSQDDILNGRLVCEIGIAPVRPAEFVIFRIFQHTAEAQR